MKTVKFVASLLIFLLSALASLVGQSAKPPSGKLSEPLHQALIPGLLRTWDRIWDKGYLVVGVPRQLGGKSKRAGRSSIRPRRARRPRRDRLV